MVLTGPKSYIHIFNVSNYSVHEFVYMYVRLKHCLEVSVLERFRLRVILLHL